MESKSRSLTTSAIARAIGVHPNTVRLYEAWGLIPPAPRSPTGYRLFSELHLDGMRLARIALEGEWPGKNIRRSLLALVKCCASGNRVETLELARRHLALVKAEQDQAEAAIEYLEGWRRGQAVNPDADPLQIQEVSRLLNISRDALRNWDRNGLLKVPRDPRNRYRLYTGVEIGRLRVIRLLRQSGYSMLAILRSLHALDRGQAVDLRQLIDTPTPGEDVYSAADRWITALTREESRAKELIRLLEEMIRKYDAG